MAQAGLAEGMLGLLDLRALKVADAQSHLQTAEPVLTKYLATHREPSELAGEALEFRPRRPSPRG